MAQLIFKNQQQTNRSLQVMLLYKLKSCRQSKILLACFSTSQKPSSLLQILYQQSKQTKTPFFTTQSHLIKIIADPLDYYMALYKQSKKAVYRIGLSSLYMGTGPLERFLLENIVKRVKSIPSLEAKMVFDYNRSLRIQKGESPVQMFNYYIGDSDKHRIKISLNKQSNSKHKLFGEISGVHHQKIAVFDDTVIIGGANLSHNYFVNRKDRYFMFRQCQQLADYLYDYVRVLEENCWQVKHNSAIKNQLTNLEGHYKLWKYSYSPDEYKPTLKQQQQYLMKIRKQKQLQQNRSFTSKAPKPAKSKNIQLSQILGGDIKVYEPLPAEEIIRRKQSVRQRLFQAREESDVGNTIIDIEQIKDGGEVEEIGQKVYIFPFIQFPSLGETRQPTIFQQILKYATEKKVPVKISSGYMNFIPQVLKILSKSEVPTQVLCSAPEANSFFRAGRYKKYIPYFYRNIEGEILKSYPDKFEIKQYSDGRWSFHAKGVWIKQQINNYLTILGSSNYNYRSRERDTQLQLYIHSTCQKFGKKLDQEWDNIEKYSKKVTIEDIKADKEIKYGGIFTVLTKFFKRFL